jgi:phosphohistidine phosphatase
MGELLRDQRLVPDIIVTSTARRAAQTTDAVASASGFDGEILSTSRLYLAEPSNYFDLFSEVPAGTQCALFVAHNPGISDLVTRMTGKSQEMCTAGVAQISCQVDEIANIEPTTRCEFVGFFRPPRE